MSGSGYFPFQALGLRRNPFGALTPDEWEEAAVLPPAAREALEGRSHVQVLGEAGRGKSTTLRGMARELRRRGLGTAFEYLPEGSNRFRTSLPGVQVFFLDEVQRLSRWERHRLLRAVRSGGLRLIAGSHEDLTPTFQRWGLPLTTLRVDAGGVEHLSPVLARRIELFSLEGPTPPRFTPDAVAWLAGEFGSDLRAMEWFLYEYFQALAAPAPITAPSLEEVRGRPAPDRTAAPPP